MSDKLAGIVLAAGLSERMSDAGPKQLLVFGDRTMVGHVVAIIEATTLDPVVVVTGHAAGAVEKAIAPGRARVVRNSDYREGNLTSLRTGLAAVGAVGAGAMVLLGDMPGIDGEVIEVVAAAWRDQRPFAAVTVYHGTAGHPFVLSAAAVDHVATLDGGKPLWSWLADPTTPDVLRVEVRGHKPGDVNTIDDYYRELRALGLGDPSQGRDDT